MSGGRRHSWVDAGDGRWALAVAWAWCVERELVPHLDRERAVVLHGEALHRGRGLPPPPGAEYARAWWLLYEGWLGVPHEVRLWRDLAEAARGGVRGLARVLLADVDPRHSLPSWHTCASVRPAGGGAWEVCVGTGSALEQVGEWPTRDAALLVARALRPRVTIQEPHRE